MKAHPLHTLRKWRLFRALSRRADLMLPRRLPGLAHPVYLRLLSHGSQIFHAPAREATIQRTFTAIMRALPGKEPHAFWDVGANIGWFTWHCATVRPDFEIVSFEPDRKNLECLRRTQRRWRPARHTIVPCAVAERSGRATFFVDDIAGATGSIEKSQSFNLHHYGHHSPEIEIETISLDEFRSGAETRPALLKIDVEGAELRTLQGSTKVLREDRPILFYESFNHRAEILDLLQAQGYLVFESDRYRAVGPETTNFLALPVACAPVVLSTLIALGYPISLPRG